MKPLGKKIINSPDIKTSGPTLILTISNGAGHVRAAEAIAEAIGGTNGSTSAALVVDVADYMSPFARFTHVRVYDWLITNAPSVWDHIDRYQKKQERTSPEWYYRRGCRQLFELAGSLCPSALVATEVGCCEIAALIKTDLELDVPLVAVNVNYDSDRAWVRSEVDLYSVAEERVRNELVELGAPWEKIEVLGVPMSRAFSTPHTRRLARATVCRWLGLDENEPIVLVAGGGEGLGQLEIIAGALMKLESVTPQIIVLAGRNERLRTRLERLRQSERGKRLRILGWTDRMADLMFAADLMVSKLGNTFDEAMAAELPIISLEPPPGSERVQYSLLDAWRVGCAVGSLDEMVSATTRLLENPLDLEAMREQARIRGRTDAADQIASWLALNRSKSNSLTELLVEEPESVAAEHRISRCY